jgi:hypothetical protein
MQGCQMSPFSCFLLLRAKMPKFMPWRERINHRKDGFYRSTMPISPALKIDIKSNQSFLLCSWLRH